MVLLAPTVTALQILLEVCREHMMDLMTLYTTQHITNGICMTVRPCQRNYMVGNIAGSYPSWGKNQVVQVILFPNLWACSLALFIYQYSIRKLIVSYSDTLNRPGNVPPIHHSSSLSFAINLTGHINACSLTKLVLLLDEQSDNFPQQHSNYWVCYMYRYNLRWCERTLICWHS